jgi:hypothetical protein
VPWRFSAAGRLDAWTGLHSGGRKPSQKQSLEFPFDYVVCAREQRISLSLWIWDFGQTSDIRQPARMTIIMRIMMGSSV